MPLKYPIVLAHGMGFRDDGIIGYWGRIPKALEARGERIFYSGSDGNGNVEGNALQMKESVDRALAVTGAEKVNIIAHSKGGLEARYLISSLGYGKRTASLTTLSTPHNGS
ncbi:MAG: triacylglycerol lipase, partial [Ruminococcus sp.]|nr:triacylglycerol lipase [Ruminococcus sp.]